MHPLIAGLAIVAAAPSAAESLLETESGPYLAWHFRSVVNSESGSDRMWFQESVSWTEADEQVLWTRRLPEWVRHDQCGIGNGEAEGLAQFPRGTHNAYFLIELLRSEGVLVVAETIGVFALAEKDGAVLLELSDLPDDRRGSARTDRFFVDQGQYSISAPGTPGCRGPLRHSGFLAACGDRLYAFNGHRLWVMSRSPLRLLKTLDYEHPKHRRKASRPGTMYAFEMPILGALVSADGMVFMR